MPQQVDYSYMSRALALARRGLLTAHPNPRVGCVVVRDDAVVGEGWHQCTGGPHAEVNALAQAGERARGATAYVTLEPCCHQGRTDPCIQALIQAGVERVVVAMQDPNPRVAGGGLRELRAAGVRVEVGLLAAEAETLNAGFAMRMRRGRPLVRCKLASSLDGRTAMASGESQWITGAAARRDGNKLRARSGAVATGVGTVLADDPALTVRPQQGPASERAAAASLRQPLRIILDSRLRTPATAKMLSLPGPTWIATCCQERAQATALARTGAEVRRFPEQNGRVNPHALMASLADYEINEVLVESGPTLAGALLQAGLVDELIIYLAPRLLGDAARGLFHLPHLQRLSGAIELVVSDIRAVGNDWRVTARPQTDANASGASAG
jgi:diaminohydroxyphosphoribosylaminopyrimidine deaminase/5-amino-6-(5-phosphoribosylamino)uracil reductase